MDEVVEIYKQALEESMAEEASGSFSQYFPKNDESAGKHVLPQAVHAIPSTDSGLRRSGLSHSESTVINKPMQ